uniref:Uncharacterized protein n=1 Tax=viral metagenome TaxID=1070528 RepID=A0A6M3JNP1_9ZZZZ
MTTFWLVTAAVAVAWLGMMLWILCIFKSGARSDLIHTYRGRPKP